MRVFVVTPALPVVSLDEAKAHLRVDGGDEGAVITAMIAAATGHIDGPDGWLGRALGVQTLEARFDTFDEACLPYPPLIDVMSVSYLNDSGTATVDAGAYETIGAQLVPVNGGSWPSPLWRREAVRVRYQAGYVPRTIDDAQVSTLPPAIRAAILLMVGDLYRNRDTASAVGPGTGVVSMSTTVEALLSPFRVWR